MQQNRVSEQDFNWNGAIKSLNAQELLSQSFDVLIGCYDGSHELLDMMVSQSKAKFKIGGVRADERLFDLLIAVEFDNMEVFKDETKKYLTVLNKLQ
jgi:hypothetical protein